MPPPLLSPDDILERLIADFGFTANGAMLTASKLHNCAPAIQQAFWVWWQSGEIPEIAPVAGYAFEQLIQEHGMTPIAAFLTLDWLLREPEQARASLKRGHDEVKAA